MANVYYDKKHWISYIRYKGKTYYLVASKTDKEKCQIILNQAIQAKKDGNLEQFYEKLKEHRMIEKAKKEVLYNSIEYEYCTYEDNSYLEDLRKNEYLCQSVKEPEKQETPEKVRKRRWKKEIKSLALDFEISENNIENIIKDAETFCGYLATGTELYNRAWANMLALI